MKRKSLPEATKPEPKRRKVLTCQAESIMLMEVCNEFHQLILAHLVDVRDAAVARQVCLKWRDIIDADQNLRYAFGWHHYFGGDSFDRSTNWKEEWQLAKADISKILNHEQPISQRIDNGEDEDISLNLAKIHPDSLEESSIQLLTEYAIDGGYQILLKQLIESRLFAYANQDDYFDTVEDPKILLVLIKNLEDSIKHLDTELGYKYLYIGVHESIELLKVVLKAGVDPNYRIPGEEFEALVRAVELDDIEMVELLLQHGADINEGYDYRPIHMAQSKSMLKFLLKHGAEDAALEEGAGLSALQMFVESGKVEMASILLDSGKAANIQEALIYANKSKNSKMIELLSKAVDYSK